MSTPLRRYFALLKLYLKPQWLKTVGMVICLLAGIGFQLVNPQIIRIFIDATGARGAVNVLVEAAGLYILAALLNQGISVAGTYFTTYVAWTATNQLRGDLMAHCLSLDLGFHKEHTSGEMIERIDGDVDALSNFFSRFAVNLMSNLLLLLGMLVFFFVIHWLVGVVMSVFALLVLGILSFMRRRALPLWEKQRGMNATYYGFLGERLDGLEDIRGNGAGQAMLSDFYRLLRAWLPVQNRANMAAASMGITMLFVYVCGTALALGLGLYLWGLHAVSIGTIYAMFAYTNALSQPLNEIQNELQDLQKAEACIQRVEKLLHTPSTLPDTGTKTLPTGPLDVEFRAIEFGYEPGEPVLRQLSFNVQPEHALGIVGRTGSGKTTLARLLFRLYDPQAGEVRVNDIPLPQIALHELRRHIGMVTQDVQIFHASLRDNLTFFERGIPDQRLDDILEEIGLGPWYRRLPEGLDTRLGSGEGETGLSAGEAQLLACARVFLVNPGIVVLDEASSRLDPATERLVEQAIARLLAGKTALIIAHRLSTLRRVDDILLLADGRILEYGPRAVLAGDPTSRFARLLSGENREVLA